MSENKKQIRVVYNVLHLYENTINRHIDGMREMMIEENDGYHPINCATPHAMLIAQYSQQLHEFMQMMGKYETELDYKEEN